MIAPALSYFCGLAAMVFITTGLVVAAVRWFHMCRPYDSKPAYYYPGRPMVTGIFLSFLLLLPYALDPSDADAWCLARLFFLPFCLFHFSVMLFAYFGNVMQWRRWRWPILIVGSPVVVAILTADVLALLPGDQSAYLSRVVLLVLGVIMTGVCAGAIFLVLAWAKRFDEDDFSNPADYPVLFARRWSVLISVNVALCWAGALADSRAFLAVIMLLFSVSSVFLLISALHPHRSKPVEEKEEAQPVEDDAAAIYHRTMSKKKQLEILTAIRAVVEEQEAFLDPHLTLQDVAARSGYNRSYISGLIKAEFGGFFPYVNRLRLHHVNAWMQAHPGVTIQEAAEESGFNSRQAYYAVKARLGE